MRPGDFSPGNAVDILLAAHARGASMRPGDFSPGNAELESNEKRLINIMLQ